MTLSAEDERRALQEVETAFERPPEKREPYLTHRLAGEPAVLERALQLLLAGGVDSTLSTQELPVIPNLARSETVRRVTPDYIGPYRIIKLLGAGGMGEVYLAERNDGAFDKQVAIKIMQSNRAPADFAQRFETERQILANVTHPNIAALLDGGYLEDDTPYLVMDYIEGVGIDEYVIAKKLSIKQTLEVFLQVCDGVQAAHQSLVVHRDIKPSNILVNEQGHLKLIDFGIAKDLAGLVGEETQVGSTSALTYDYASPEQYLRERVTTATDVYGLGIVLFNLLSGCKPYSTSDKSLSEVHDLIVEAAIPSMQQAIERAITDGEDLRITRNQIPHELELIVAKAATKESARRYGTAQNLADDVRAYLAGRPVVAQGDSWRYLTAKFVRRHWLGFSATTAVVLAMVTALLISIEQKRMADEAAAHSNSTSEFLAKLLLAPSSRADSPLRLGSEAKVSELLDHAAAELKGDRVTQFDGAPGVRAELMLTVGRTYHGLAMYPQAIELLREASTLCEVNECSRNALGARIDFRLGQSLVLTGQPDEALSLFARAAAVEDEVLRLARIADETASALWSTGDRTGTVAKMKEAVELYEQAAGDELNLAVAVSYTRLGSLYSNVGQLESALAMLREGAALYESLGQTSVPELADLYNEIGLIFLKRGDRESYSEYLQRAYAVTEVLGGVSEIELLIVTNLGHDALENGRPEVARQWLNKANDALARFATGNTEHEARAWVLRLEGRVLALKQRYQQALDAHSEALRIYSTVMPAYNHSHAGAERYIGDVLEEMGRLDDALPYHKRVLEYYESVYDEEESRYLVEAQERLSSLETRLAQ